MKKLMIAAAIACATGLAQAASVAWNSGTMYAATAKDGSCPTTGSTGKSGSSGHATTAYIYYFETLEAYNTAKATSVENLYKNYVLNTSVTPKASDSLKPNGILNKSIPAANGGDENPQTVYGMEIFVDTATAENYADVDAFVKVGFGTATWKDTVGATFSDVGLQQSKWTAVGAVPEPTSGLLLLLGVAGLALRRRRA